MAILLKLLNPVFLLSWLPNIEIFSSLLKETRFFSFSLYPVYIYLYVCICICPHVCMYVVFEWRVASNMRRGIYNAPGGGQVRTTWIKVAWDRDEDFYLMFERDSYVRHEGAGARWSLSFVFFLSPAHFRGSGSRVWKNCNVFGKRKKKEKKKRPCPCLYRM